jgi:hypothetical protein
MSEDPRQEVELLLDLELEPLDIDRLGIVAADPNANPLRFTRVIDEEATPSAIAGRKAPNLARSFMAG